MPEAVFVSGSGCYYLGNHPGAADARGLAYGRASHAGHSGFFRYYLDVRSGFVSDQRRHYLVFNGFSFGYSS